MRESKFIELLNLYIDQRIAPEDAALLEEEIMQSPQRRETYSQYCRMHRACTMVLDRYQAQNGLENPADKLVALARPRRVRWGYYATGLAAAACVAFVAVQTVLRPGRVSPGPVATAQPALGESDAAIVMTPVRIETPSSRVLSKTEGYVTQQLRFALPMTAPANRVALAASDSRGARRAPLQAPAVSASAHLSIDDFVFAHESATPEHPNIFRVRQSTDDQAENVAIEYQRQ